MVTAGDFCCLSSLYDQLDISGKNEIRHNKNDNRYEKANPILEQSLICDYQTIYRTFAFRVVGFTFPR